MSSASLGMTDYSIVSMVRVTWPVFKVLPPIISLELVKLGTVNFVCTSTGVLVHAWYITPKPDVCSHVTSLNFGA